MPSQYEVFDVKYHLFWSPENWTPEDNCQKVKKIFLKNAFLGKISIFLWDFENVIFKGTGLNEPECCGPPEGPLAIFNSLDKQCCPDYSIEPYGMCST